MKHLYVLTILSFITFSLNCMQGSLTPLNDNLSGRRHNQGGELTLKLRQDEKEFQRARDLLEKQIAATERINALQQQELQRQQRNLQRQMTLQYYQERLKNSMVSYSALMQTKLTAALLMNGFDYGYNTLFPVSSSSSRLRHCIDFLIKHKAYMISHDFAARTTLVSHRIARKPSTIFRPETYTELKEPLKNAVGFWNRFTYLSKSLYRKFDDYYKRQAFPSGYAQLRPPLNSSRVEWNFGATLYEKIRNLLGQK